MISFMMRSPWFRIEVVFFALFMGACKNTESTCQPDAEWSLQLALQASDTINPTDEGEPLPTVIRVFQLRGELAIDGLDFEQLWAVEEASALGESFLSMEEITMFPARNELRELPVESDATHVLAAGLFRKPSSTSWFTSYEIPRQHPQVVCAKAPVDKVYPDPCFYVRLDRNGLGGGATPPAGYLLEGGLHCAPLGVDIAPEVDDRTKNKNERRERRKRRRQRRQNIEKKPDDLQRRLDGQRPDLPADRSDLPNPELPKRPEPSIPEARFVPER